MKVVIIGGGPAGLYAAILLRKQRPEAQIAVYERNRADDTFGFGVVFSDATLDNFEKYDPPSYRRITQEFAYWDDIAVHFRGTVHRVGGNGFCGCSRRKLLLILQERARELGVHLQFQTDIDDEARFADAGLIILADGINSRFREKHVDHFQPEIDVEVVGVGDMDKLELRVDIRHKSNWSNETVRAARRSKFMCALVLAMRKVPIRAPGAAAPEEESKEDGGDDSDPGAELTQHAAERPRVDRRGGHD